MTVPVGLKSGAHVPPVSPVDTPLVLIHPVFISTGQLLWKWQ